MKWDTENDKCIINTDNEHTKCRKLSLVKGPFVSVMHVEIYERYDLNFPR